MRPILLIALILFTGLSHAQSCTATSAQQAATHALQLQRKLLSASVPTMDTDVPEGIRATLHDFKQSLITTVDAALRCNNPDPSQLQSNLAQMLYANEPEKSFVPTPAGAPWPKTETGTYGGEIHVAVQVVSGQPNLYSIKLTYAIECGQDNILLLYRRTPAGYQRELLWQNPDLNSVGDAFGDMYLTPIVPSDPAHPYLIAVIHGTPWCTSNISVFHIDLLAPAQSGKPQAVLDHIDQHFRREDEPRLRVTADGFDLRVTADDLATSLIMRPGVFRYRTNQGKLDRVQPIALNGRDFVDEWLQVPWTQAAKWSASPLPGLKAFLDRFDYKLHPNGTDSIDDYSAVRACKGSPNVFQVQIDIAAADAKTPAQQFYARIQQGNNSFTMLSTYPDADPACAGPNLVHPQ